MKNFTKENIKTRNNPYTNKPLHSITCHKEDLLIKPLWFHEQNLMQTATGYGEALKTIYMVKFENRIFRVLCKQFSNIGSLYIKTKEYGHICIDCYT